MIIAMDLGATEIKVAPVNNGKMGKTLKVPTNADGGAQAITQALRRAVALIPEKAEGLAVATAGTVDEKACKITFATQNLPGMTGFDFRRFFANAFPVSVINDAHAALLGEMHFGAGKKLLDKRVAMFTLGSGVGGAYWKNGSLCADQSNDFARFGHVTLKRNGRKCTCGKLGCVETYLSGRAMHRDAAKLGIEGSAFDTNRCDVPANAIFLARIRQYLAATLKKINALCPFDAVIIGGGAADWMGDCFGKVTAGICYRVIRASLGNDAGLYGAWAHWQEENNV